MTIGWAILIVGVLTLLTYSPGFRQVALWIVLGVVAFFAALVVYYAQADVNYAQADVNYTIGGALVLLGCLGLADQQARARGWIMGTREEHLTWILGVAMLVLMLYGLGQLRLAIDAVLPAKQVHSFDEGFWPVVGGVIVFAAGSAAFDWVKERFKRFKPSGRSAIASAFGRPFPTKEGDES